MCDMYRYYTTNGTTNGTTNAYRTDCTGYVTANSYIKNWIYDTQNWIYDYAKYKNSNNIYIQNWVYDYVKRKNTEKTISEDEIMKILKE